MSFRRVEAPTSATSAIPRTAAGFVPMAYDLHAGAIPYTGMLSSPYGANQYASTSIPYTGSNFQDHGNVPNTSVHWRGFLPYYWGEGITDDQYRQYSDDSERDMHYTYTDAWNKVKNYNYPALAGQAATLATAYAASELAQQYAGSWIGDGTQSISEGQPGHTHSKKGA